MFHPDYWVYGLTLLIHLGWKISTTCAWEDTIGRNLIKKHAKDKFCRSKICFDQYKIQEFEVDLTWCGFCFPKRVNWLKIVEIGGRC